MVQARPQGRLYSTGELRGVMQGAALGTRGDLVSEKNPPSHPFLFLGNFSCAASYVAKSLLVLGTAPTAGLDRLHRRKWGVDIITGCFSAASQTTIKGKSITPANDRGGSAVVFPVTGNVYPAGHYSVILNIGNPPKAFDLDIDTGSDLTWVQCDAPCTGCTKPLDKLYNPKNNRVPCSSSLCQAVSTGQKYNCDTPTEQCDYEVQYADLGSSFGVLLADYFPLRLTNNSLLQPRIAFGCGYDQKYLGPHSPPDTAGILGLGRGKASILSQLRTLGITKNVVGHCFSRVAGGFLFFGDRLLPASGITWTPMLRSPSE
ncbi:hypothetical protein SADUNF_Sadunf02G0068100 [Salix dunnii]|uniref:Peptidase A1 domain-containing protein n=1 Tax=Salix dunnii TaxID=1413687 RepID=A0A835N6I5_9ROSI|nr:hypothetical protein SADUNF_Sadunf02G0068100 [Salix dunnii]